MKTQNQQGLPVAMITGASSGIGQATAIRLAKDGHSILAHYHRNEMGMEATVTKIREIGGTVEVIQFDIRDREKVDSSLDRFFSFDSNRYPSILVNNAGIHRDNLAGLMSDDEFSDVIRTNVEGAFYCLRWCVRRMLRQREGAIVNISSLAGQVGNAGQINYSASKAALIAMTRSLAQEIGPRGVRVNAVAPGLIETEMITKIPYLEELKQRIPLRRVGTAEEVASCVSFLCSKDASYITGHTLSVNGGLFPG